MMECRHTNAPSDTGMDCCKRLCRAACLGGLLRLPSQVSRKTKPLSGAWAEGAGGGCQVGVGARGGVSG